MLRASPVCTELGALMERLAVADVIVFGAAVGVTEIVPAPVSAIVCIPVPTVPLLPPMVTSSTSA